MVNGHKPEITLMQRLKNRGRDYSKFLRCPLDGEPLLRREIGGRTTYSCAQHQR